MYQHKITKAVKVIENYKCHTRRCPPPDWMAKNVVQRAKKTEPTSEEQKKINEKKAYDDLRYLIMCNFVADDFYVTLTYEKEPSPEEAKKNIKNFVKRLQYFFTKIGQVLKYVHITEYEKERRKERIHHHIVINKIPELGVRKIKKLWGLGGINYKPYLGEPIDAEYISNYFIKEEHSAFYKDEKIFKTRYTPSRNMKKPEVKRQRVPAATFREPIKAPKGYYLDKSSIRRGFTNWGYPYLFYRFIKNEEEQDEKLEQHVQKTRTKRRAGIEKNSSPPGDTREPAKRKTVKKKIRNGVRQ